MKPLLAAILMLATELSHGLQQEDRTLLVEELQKNLTDQTYDRAIEILKKLAAAEPANYLIQNLLGTTRDRAGHSSEATASYLRALELQPSSSIVRLNLALNYLRLVRYMDAAREFKFLIDEEGSPSPPVPNLYQQAHVGSELERFARSLRAEEIQYASLGRLFLHHHLPQAAAAVLSAGTQALPNSSQLHYLLGWSLQETGRFAEAQVSYRKAMEVQPDFFECCLRLGFSHSAAGEVDKSIETYRHCVRMKPSNYAGHYFLGMNLMRAMAPGVDEAIAHLEEAARLNTHSWDSHLQLGKAYQIKGSYAQALREFNIVARENPWNEEVHYRLGMLYQKQNQTEAAQEHLQRFKNLKSQQYAREATANPTGLIDSPRSAMTEIAGSVVTFWARFKNSLINARYQEIWNTLTEGSRALYDNDPVRFSETLSRLDPAVVNRIKRSSVSGGKLVAGRIICDFQPVDGASLPPLVLIQNGNNLEIDYAFDLALNGLARLGAK